MPDEEPHRSQSGVWRRDWTARIVLLVLAILGGLVWWQVGPGSRILSPETRRREARAFLRLAVAEAGGEREPNKAELLSEIAPLQDAAGDTPGAEATAASIEDVTRQREKAVGQGKAWIAIAAVRFKAGNVAGGRRAFDAAVRSAEPLAADPYHHGEALSDVAAAQAEAGEIEAAARTAAAIGEARHQATAWVAITTAQIGRGDVDGSRRSLARVSDEAKAASDMDVWITLADAQARAGDTVGRDRSYVRAAAQAHTSANLDGFAHLAVKIALRPPQVGDREGAGRTLELAAEAERTISGADGRSSLLEFLATCRAINGDPAGARQAMDALLTESHRWRIVSQLALVQSENGDLPAALATVRTVAEPDDQANLLRDIAVQRAEQGDKGGSQRIFALAIQTAQTNPSGDGLNESLRRIASKQANAGDPAAALRTMSALGDQSNGEETWTDIAVALAKAGDAAGAERIFRRHLQREEYVWWKQKCDWLLWKIGRPAYFVPAFTWTSGHWELVQEGFRTRAVSAVGRARARAGDIRTAAASVRQLPAGNARCEGYQEIAAGLLEAPVGRGEH